MRVGCVEGRKRPSLAIEAPSELMETQGRASCLRMFASSMLKKTACTRERSSSTRSSSVSTGSLPRLAATSFSVRPMSGRSDSVRKPTRSVGDIAFFARISLAMRARVTGAARRA
jgi:hypothetical protein